MRLLVVLFLAFLLLLLATLFEELVKSGEAAELFEELFHVAEIADFTLRDDVDGDDCRFDSLNQVGEGHRRAAGRLDSDGLRAGLLIDNLRRDRQRADSCCSEERRHHGLPRNAKFHHSYLQLAEKTPVCPSDCYINTRA